MSGGIELQINGQTYGITQNPEQSLDQAAQLIEYLIQASGDENGAAYFNLDWQNQQAEFLRQTLTTIYGATSTEQNNAENMTNRTLNDLINLARDHEDFKEFRRSPENFWQQVRQMSEARIIKDNIGNETRTASRFDELLANMQAKKMSLREFVQTLPPNEREVFKAAYQLRETFGANLSNSSATLSGNGTTLNEAAQTRLSEAPTDARRAAVLREGKFTLSGNATNTTHGELMFGAKGASLLGASVTAAPQNLKSAASSSPASQAAAPQAASPTANGSAAGASAMMPENLAARSLNNSASANAANSGAALRDNGMVIGCALISGAFTSIENHQNTEQQRAIGDARAKGSVFGEGNGFAAGATGAMFGAAVGTVVPGAETMVSGVLGFVSSVVVGVDVNQGLRWLGSGAMAFSAVTDGGANANNHKHLTTGSSLISVPHLQPVLA